MKRLFGLFFAGCLVFGLPHPAGAGAPGVRVPPEWIRASVTAAIEGRYLDGRERVKEVRVPGEIVLPPGDTALEVLPPEEGHPLVFPVAFRVDGEVRKQVAVTVSVETLTEVVVAARPIGRYQPIAPGDLVVRQMAVADLDSGYFSDPEALSGMRSARVLMPNTVITRSMVEEPPLVKRGDIVTVTLESDTMRITTLGEVQKMGRRGDLVRVMNMETRRSVYGRVVDARTLKVEF